MTWFQLIAAVAFSIALTLIGYVIVIEEKERVDESVRRMELRREIRQLIREADAVPADSSAKGLSNCAAIVGYALLAATE